VSEQISAFFSSVLKISRIALEDRREAYREVRDGSWPRRRFYVLVALSAIIAGYGLLSGSVAVIIGAMLVAPLMGPIFGIALSLVSGDVKLLRASLTAEIFGVFLADIGGEPRFILDAGAVKTFEFCTRYSFEQRFDG